MTQYRQPPFRIETLISDVDGTLLGEDKLLTTATVDAVKKLQHAGVKFTIVSSRPPRGLTRLIAALDLTFPVAGFNGGVIASPDLSILSEHLIERDVAYTAIAAIEQAGASAWVFSGNDWCIRSRNGPRVELEQRTVGFAPTIVKDFATVAGTASKIVAVSDAPDTLARLQNDMRIELESVANIVRSQEYYLDFTHPLANKGEAVREIIRLMDANATTTAVMGDGENDVDMFDKGGLSIAMGNASEHVKHMADFVTASNEEDGAAVAIDWFILGGHRASLGRLTRKAVR
jgi:hypothetical protein